MCDSLDKTETDGEVAVSILIVTRNRRDEVLVAVESALAQDWQPLEVLVFDDASSDGTADAVAGRFPQVRLFRGREKSSANVLRNRGFTEAKGRLIVSLDDDCYFTHNRTVRTAVSSFTDRPWLAVLGLPYIEPRNYSAHRARHVRAGEPIASYTGCAAVLRTHVVLEAGGYREWWGYMREEPDLSIRIHQLGYELEQGDTPLLVHTKSLSRNANHQDWLGIRNQIFFLWLNLPVEHALLRTITYFFGMLRYRFSIRDVPWKIAAFAEGCVKVYRHMSERRPVTRSCYKRFRSLPSHGRQPWGAEVIPLPCKRSGTTAKSIGSKNSC